MNKLKLTSILCMLLSAFFAQSQNVYFYDISSVKPIPEVFIIDHKFVHSVTADEKGVADFSGFQPTDTLIIQHPSYNRRIITVAEIMENNRTVYLTESAVDLLEFTVMANKRKQLRTDVPNMIVPIYPKDVEFANPQTSADLLANTGEVFVQKSQMGGGSPMIRGFTANRVLIVVDGVRMNNAIFRSGNLQNVISIDANNISESEVIYGPGSVIYGSDALGGVMSFRTMDPKLSFKEDSITAYGGAMFRFSTANQELTAHVKAGVGGEKAGILFAYTGSNFSDLESGSIYHPDHQDFGKRNWYQFTLNGKDTVRLSSNPQSQIESRYSQQNFMVKTRFQPTSKIDLGLNAHYSATSDVPRYDRLVLGDETQPQFSRWYYGPQRWFLGTLTGNFDFGNDAWDKAQITIGYQNFEESRNDRRYQNPNLRRRQERVNVFTGNFDFDRYLGDKHTLYYGFEGVYNQVFSEASNLNVESGRKSTTSTRYPDGGSYWASAAAYMTYKWKINKKLTFNTGVRFTYIEMQSQFSDTTFYNFPFNRIKLQTSAFNGSFIGLTYRPAPKWQIGINTASGFRAPNIDDLAKVFDSEPGKVVVPNPELRPEYAYNTELSIARELAFKGIVEVVGFYTYLVDAMVRRASTFNGQDSIVYDGSLSQVQKITNAGRAHVYGASLNMRINITKSMGFVQTFTWTGGEDLIDNVPLRAVAPAFGKTAFFFKGDKIRAEVFSMYNAWRHWDDLAPEEKGKPHIYTSAGTPAWWTLNMRGSYHFNQFASLSLGIENLIDYHYRPYSSGISAPGRNFVLTLRVKV